MSGMANGFRRNIRSFTIEINNAVFSPVISDEDIGIGSKWHDSLDKELQSADFGILCVTEENADSPWLCYESGVLGISTAENDKRHGASHVAPILFGNVDRNRLAPPIGQFQSIAFEEDKMLDLALQLNAYSRSVNPHSRNFLDERNITENFKSAYPVLKAKIQVILPKIRVATPEIKIEFPPKTGALTHNLDEFDAALMDEFDAALAEFQCYDSVDDTFKRLSKLGSFLSSNIRNEGLREDYRHRARQYQELLQGSQGITRNPTQSYALRRLINALSALLGEYARH